MTISTRQTETPFDVGWETIAEVEVLGATMRFKGCGNTPKQSIWNCMDALQEAIHPLSLLDEKLSYAARDLWRDAP